MLKTVVKSGQLILGRLFVELRDRRVSEKPIEDGKIVFMP